MTTQEVADQLVQLCREGKYEQIYAELYSEDALSIEPEGSPLGTSKGLEEMREKGKKWNEIIEKVHSSEISDPVAAENFFSCAMKTKVTIKGSSELTDMDEICLYRVENGKIMSEQFFYTTTPGQYE